MNPLDKEVAEFMEGLDFELMEDGYVHGHPGKVWKKRNKSGGLDFLMSPKQATFFYTAFRKAELKARLDQTRLLKDAQQKFGKIDFELALYALEERPKIAGAQLNQTNTTGSNR